MSHAIVKTIAYPRVLRRVQAILIDSIIVPVGTFGVLILASQQGVHGVYSAIIVGVTIFALEPLMVSLTGGTLGHHIIGIRVISKKTTSNINIISAIVRFVVKVLLGLLSIISIFTTRQHQAIHDTVVGSIVILKNPQGVSSREVLGEREIETLGYMYPSKMRRSIMIVIYNLALLIVFAVISTLSLSENCAVYNKCSTPENIIAYSLSILWLIGVAASVILCWKGMLFGCRRKLEED